MERTVSKGIEYFEPNVKHKYQIYYISPDGYQTSKNYDSYQEAFDAAITFATRVKGSDKIDNDKKVSVLKSTQIIDSTEERDVTTSELKNEILRIMNS